MTSPFRNLTSADIDRINEKNKPVKRVLMPPDFTPLPDEPPRKMGRPKIGDGFRQRDLEKRKAERAASKSKYNAKKTIVDGITFASKKEAARYSELVLLQKANAITDLKLQPVIHCDAGGVHICDYRADFFYYDRMKKLPIHEDCKGFKTPVYKLKKRVVLALTGIKIFET